MVTGDYIFSLNGQVGRENTLLYVDIPDDDVISGSSQSQLMWNPLFEPTFQPGALAAKATMLQNFCFVADCAAK